MWRASLAGLSRLVGPGPSFSHGPGGGPRPRPYLTRVVTRLTIDALRTRRARRETYPGCWLPEPVATDPSPFGAVDISDLSVAVLHLMEQLTPPQRAVYVLRTAFGLPYEQIGAIVDHGPAHCRQRFRRAAAFGRQIAHADQRHAAGIERACPTGTTPLRTR